MPPGPIPKPPLDRLLALAMPIPFSGCWVWEGAVYGDYGQFKMTSRDLTGAHRASWILHRGPIPDGLFVLHKCDVKVCVNPEHLFLGTNQDNLIDFATKYPGRLGAHNAAKTHCANGHEYTVENTGRDRNNHRFCNRCAREKTARYLRRKKCQR